MLRCACSNNVDRFVWAVHNDYAFARVERGSVEGDWRAGAEEKKMRGGEMLVAASFAACAGVPPHDEVEPTGGWRRP